MLPYGFDNSSLDLMPSFDPLNVKDKITTMAMNRAGSAWNLGNSGGSALGSPGSALGAPGSALGGSGSFFGGGAGAAGAGANAGRFSLSGVKGAEDLALKTPGAGFQFSSLAGLIPQAALATGLPQAIFGRYTGNILGQGASGALTGMAMGGPVGAAVGGGVGALGSAITGKQGQQRPPMQVPVTPMKPDLYSNY